MQTWHIQLASPDDWDGFRRAARHLLQAATPPEAIHWQADRLAPDGTRSHSPSLWQAAGDTPCDVATLCATLKSQAGTAVSPRPLHLAREALQRCQSASLHQSPERFTLLYRWLWRVQTQQTSAHDPLDSDWIAISRLAKAVGREIHKMRAFVRFRPVPRENAPVLHMAWFEPAHYVTRANADFFVRRFTNMHWCLLTPDLGLHWDGQQLATSTHCDRRQVPDDHAGDALWLTYYASTFNAARYKPLAMEREMPRRYWKHLPEAQLIRALETQALQPPHELPTRNARQR
jgi:probable DNA metabolism protein